MPRRFNEGKALDAVLRVLEKREAAYRSAVRSPEAEHHSASIDLACTIGSRGYALEHTGIEPFRDQIAMGQHNNALLVPVVERLRGSLPADQAFELHVPVDAATRTKLKPARIVKIQDALVDWIQTTAPSLQMAPPGRYLTPIQKVDIPGVPFPVSLHRLTPLGPEFCGLSILTLVSDDLEVARRERIADMCSKKYGKLQHWKSAERARTILVLEDADMQLTNHMVVAEALAAAEAQRPDHPDEIYLVTSYLPTHWHVICLRRGTWAEYEAPDERWEYEEFDPATLADLTQR